jgi:chorismate dehydratase
MTYLNSEVFYRKLPIGSCDLVAMSPRTMAEAVERGRLAAGPLPSAAVIRLGGLVRSLGNLGVASHGAAMSVLLFSHVPVDQLCGKRIAITSHTVTSVQLLRVLFADLWRVSGHRFVETTDGHDAVLWIGDLALARRDSSEYQYRYDLGDAWKDLTGLPFVFAEWVVGTEIPKPEADRFEQKLIQATYDGLRSVDEIIRARTIHHMSDSDVSEYVQNFTYFLGSEERAGQREFDRRLNSLSGWRQQGYKLELGVDEPTTEEVISAP